MRRCRAYVGRKPTFSQEATALRRKSERYAELVEAVASRNLQNEICECIVDLKALAESLERVISGEAGEPCISCDTENCLIRKVALKKPTRLD